MGGIIMKKCEFINLVDHSALIYPRKLAKGECSELLKTGKTLKNGITLIDICKKIINVYAQEVNNGLKIKIEVAWNWGKEENPVGEISTIHYSYHGKYLICWGESKKPQQLTPAQVRAIQ